MSERIIVKDTARTRELCINGLKGYVEREGGGRYDVIVFDPFDGGPCGPFRLDADDIESASDVKGSVQCEARPPVL
jgi:hypothetical protein